MRRVVVVSFRLGGADGVSAEAEKWKTAFKRLGCSVFTVAGEGVADCADPGLAPGSYVTGRPAPAPDPSLWRPALLAADLVVVENLCSLPLNPAASAAIASTLRGRRAILRHHDLPWQRRRFGNGPPPPDDPAWCHVTVNDLSRRQLEERGIRAITVRNAFDPHPAPGDRQAVRAALGVPEGQVLVVQPTRAVPRKGVPAAIALAEHLDAFYWLVGPAEEGYGPTVEALLRRTRARAHWGPVGPLVNARQGMEQVYAGADLIAFPSIWEGFGNPPVEASLHLRPVAVGPYPVGAELRSLGFSWLDAGRPAEVARWLSNPDEATLQHNAEVARRHLNLDDLPGKLAELMQKVGL
jgi:glycosyltransferase involved in cell wall biosynthesis